MEGAQTPAGPAGQARPRRRFGAEEAHRPPHGKRSSLEWKATAHPRANKKTIDRQCVTLPAFSLPNIICTNNEKQTGRY
ncbi:Ribose 5-phosphate isomerase B [Bacillus badius]|nr:Ribose 5-phosphate isomerase B [Bacillus badius]